MSRSQGANWGSPASLSRRRSSVITAIAGAIGVAQRTAAERAKPVPMIIAKSTSLGSSTMRSSRHMAASLIIKRTMRSEVPLGRSRPCPPFHEVSNDGIDAGMRGPSDTRRIPCRPSGPRFSPPSSRAKIPGIRIRSGNAAQSVCATSAATSSPTSSSRRNGPIGIPKSTMLSSSALTARPLQTSARLQADRGAECD